MSQYELSSQNLSIMEGGKNIEERCGSQVVRQHGQDGTFITTLISSS